MEDNPAKHDSLGTIESIHRLNFPCGVCGKPAVLEITRSNKGLPSVYSQSGTRVINRCEDHVPEDARQYWEFYSNPFNYDDPK